MRFILFFCFLFSTFLPMALASCGSLGISCAACGQACGRPCSPCTMGEGAGASQVACCAAIMPGGRGISGLFGNNNGRVTKISESIPVQKGLKDASSKQLNPRSGF